MRDSLPDWSWWLSAYGGAGLAVAAALLATWALPALHSTPSVLFFAAVVAAAWLGGRGPACLAIVLSILAQDYFVVEPRYSLLASIDDVVRFLAFVFIALLVCYLQDSLQRLATRLQQANDVLEARVRERTSTLAIANDSLTAEVQERRRAQEALIESEARLRVALGKTDASLRQRDILLRELHHRVKNNLQTIVSLLSLQAKSSRNPSGCHPFKELQQRVRAIAMVHDRLHKAGDLGRIDIAEYFRDLVQVLLRSYSVGAGVVRPKIDVDETVLGIDHLMPCALIVNELVCNALKYAYPEGRSGEIRIELQRKEQVVRMSVADDGIGFSRADQSSHATVGLQIVEALVHQIIGRIQWANEHGACATITFQESN